MSKHYSSRPSKLLTVEQNRGVFSTLRPNSTALVTTVAILYYNKDQKWTRQYFGILCIERDNGIKKYFLRFYDMQSLKLMIQQKIKRNFGKSFTVLRELFFQMTIHERTIGFEFIDTPAGWEESNYVAKGLRGNTKKLKLEAETRYYEEHPEKQKESRFKRLFRRKNRESRSELPYLNLPPPSHPPSHPPSPQPILPCMPYDVMQDPGVKIMLNNMGIDAEEALETTEGRLEVEKFIESFGGGNRFKQLIIEHGIVRGVGKPTGLPADSQATKLPMNSVPVTPPKVALDAIANFVPSQQVEPLREINAYNYDDFCMGNSKEEELYQRESDKPSSGPPIKNLSTLPTKKATSPSPTKPETPEKEGAPKLKSAADFVLEVNKLCQKLYEILARKRKSEGKGKRVQAPVDKDKKGQGKENVVSSTTEESTGTTTSDSDSDEEEKEETK